MTTIEAYNLVKTICNTAVQRGFFGTTGDVVQVHEALTILEPHPDSSDKEGPRSGF